jgi:hypothetical protein
MIQLPKNELKNIADSKNKFILIEGKNGSGKTFKSATISHEMFGTLPLIISIDKKADKTQLPAVNIETVSEFKQVIKQLEQQRNKKHFNVIVFDVLSNLNDAVFNAAAEKLGKTPDLVDWTNNYGSEKRPYIDLWKEITKDIINLSKTNQNGEGYTVIVTDYTITIGKKKTPTFDAKGNKTGEIVEDIEGVAISEILAKQIPFVLQTIKAECDEHIKTISEYDSFANKPIFKQAALSSRNEQELLETIMQNNPQIVGVNAELIKEQETPKQEQKSFDFGVPEVPEATQESANETNEKLVAEAAESFSWN